MDKRVLAFFIVLFGVFPIFAMTSYIHVGEPRFVEAKVTSMGAAHGATGSTVVFTSITNEGERISFDSTFGEVLRVGDKVKIKARDRLLFFPDSYFFVEKIK